MEKKRWFSSSAFVLLLCSSLTAVAQAKPADFRFLLRLQGTWIMRTRESVIAEQWQRINDSTLQGHTWRIVGKDSSLQATAQLIRSTDSIYYVPLIQGQHSGRLTVRVLKVVGFIAENMGNGFPQKVTYRWKDEEHMGVKMEGKQGNTTGEVLFQYVRQ